MGKGSWLIAGYNTASEEEKSKINKEKLCRAMGAMTGCLALLTALLAYFDNESFAIFYGIALCVLVVLTGIHVNKKCQKKSSL